MSLDKLREFIFRMQNALDKTDQDKCIIVMTIIAIVLLLTASLSLAIFHLNEISLLFIVIVALYSPTYTVIYYVKLIKYYKDTKWLF